MLCQVSLKISQDIPTARIFPLPTAVLPEHSFESLSSAPLCSSHLSSHLLSSYSLFYSVFFLFSLILLYSSYSSLLFSSYFKSLASQAEAPQALQGSKRSGALLARERAAPQLQNTSQSSPAEGPYPPWSGGNSPCLQ